MRVCLVRPPSIINPLAYIGSLTPPIGLAYLAASLRKAGHDVSLVDGIGENPEQSTPLAGNLVARGLTFDEIVARIPPGAQLVGVSGMFSSEWTQIRELVNRIAAAHPAVPLVAGGEHFTAAAEVSMRQCPGLDICVMGEGEETLVELTQAIVAGSNLEAVAGLVLRRADGTFHRTETRARLREVDAITQPAWDLVPLENYLSRSLVTASTAAAACPCWPRADAPTSARSAPAPRCGPPNGSRATLPKFWLKWKLI